MKALLGRKLGMTQIFDENGTAFPVTLIQAGPCTITAIRQTEKDGYQAIQIGYGIAKRLNKALTGHFKESKAAPAVVREVRTDKEMAVGDNLTVTVFEVGDKVAVTSTSKGKGFAGTIKRHNFARGPMTHGSRSKRAPGSIGSMYPQNIKKGKKMAGQMGHETVTVKNLQVKAIDEEANLLAVRGAVPGPRGSIVMIKGQI